LGPKEREKNERGDERRKNKSEGGGGKTKNKTKREWA